MRALTKGLAVLFAAVTVAACGGDDGITEPENIAGTYVLQTFNGSPPPITILDITGYKLEVTAASYTFTSSGTYTNSVTLRETEDGVVTTHPPETTAGTYTVNGSAITLTDSEGSITGTISGNTLTFTEDGMTAVFVR